MKISDLIPICHNDISTEIYKTLSFYLGNEVAGAKNLDIKLSHLTVEVICAFKEFEKYGTVNSFKAALYPQRDTPAMRRQYYIDNAKTLEQKLAFEATPIPIDEEPETLEDWKLKLTPELILLDGVIGVSLPGWKCKTLTLNIFVLNRSHVSEIESFMLKNAPKIKFDILYVC